MRLLPHFNVCIALACFVFIVAPVKSYAQTITENQPLRFGQLSLTDNSAPRKIILNSAGGYTADPQYILFTDPQLGNVTVSGFDPSVTLSVGVSTATLTGASAANFTVIDTFTNPTIITTDGAGSATFDVGATLQSDGSGTVHADDTFDGIYSINVVAP